MGSPPQPGPRGYLSLDRGTHWASKGLPIAGAESPPRLPCTGPQSSLQSGLVVACLRYLQRKVKQQITPTFWAGLHPLFLGRWNFTAHKAIFFSPGALAPYWAASEGTGLREFGLTLSAWRCSVLGANSTSNTPPNPALPGTLRGLLITR